MSVEPGTACVFWREHRGKIEPIPAVYVGPSEPICGLCREKQAGHARHGRRHSFGQQVGTIGGVTLDVHYPPEQGGIVRYENVQTGKAANCWTLDEDGTPPAISGRFNIDLADALIGQKGNS